MTAAPARGDRLSRLSKLRDQISTALRELVNRRLRSRGPALDVIRDDDALLVRADIPGAAPGDVRIEVERNILRISGSQGAPGDEQHAHYVIHERRCGSFARSVEVPAGVDVEEIRATSNDGVVEVRIPIPPAQQKETIAVTPAAG